MFLTRKLARFNERLENAFLTPKIHAFLMCLWKVRKYRWKILLSGIAEVQLATSSIDIQTTITLRLH